MHMNHMNNFYFLMDIVCSGKISRPSLKIHHAKQSITLWHRFKEAGWRNTLGIVNVCQSLFFWTETYMGIHRHDLDIDFLLQYRVKTIPKGLQWPSQSQQTLGGAKYSNNMIHPCWMLGCHGIPTLMRMSITQTVMDFLITVLSCSICHPKFFHFPSVLLKLICVLSCGKIHVE